MCGIVGLVEFNRQVDADLVVRMRDTMTHRGPDDAGIWSSSDGSVVFGHRRLSIIDLSSAGHQPMVKDDLCITFNGEIYNYQALRASLARYGHTFSTRTDTEAILAAYRQWGPACVDYLTGMFAFAIYDRREQRIFLARDRAGEKPLYYSHKDGRFAFASEMKGLMADPRQPRRLDPTALNVFLGYGYVPGAMSILQGVSKLRPAHAMTVDLRTQDVRVWQYWSLPARARENITLDDAVHELDHLLAQSVRNQLQADVPVAVLLSGGVDSSLITAMTTKAAPRIKTFTVAFPGHGEFDESIYARTVADHFGTDHTEITAEPVDPGLLTTLARQFDEPIADHSLIPTSMVSSIVRQHATVALGGDGGDELFGGYKHYSWLQKLSGYFGVMPLPMRQALAYAGRRSPMGTRAKTYLVGLNGSLGAMLSHVDMYFDHGSRADLLNQQIWDAATLQPEAYKQSLRGDGSLLRQATALDYHTFMVDDVLTKVDRASMLTSLEVRAPLLDHSIIEFAFSLPDHLRATVTERKIVPRRLASRYLPSHLDLTRKQGFSVPINDWLATSPARETFRDILLGSSDGVFKRPVVEELLDLQDKGYANGKRIFALAMFELWRREYNVSF